MKTFKKIATGEGDDYTTGCLLDYPYFKRYKMVVIVLSKQQAIETDPKAIQTNFAENLVENVTISFLLEEVKATTLGSSRGTIRVL